MYVKYNPVKYVDPSGHNSFLPQNINLLMTDGGNNQYKTANIVFNTYETSSPTTESNSSIYRSGTFNISVQFGPDHCFITDYYSDLPTKYEDGETVKGTPISFAVIIDFLTTFASLIPPEEAGNDTWISLAYTLNGNQFSIDSASIITSIHGDGLLYFNGFDFSSGAYGGSVGYPSHIAILPLGPVNIIDNPIYFSSEDTLNITMNFYCDNCYNTGNGNFGRSLPLQLSILMGKASLDHANLGEILVP